jgi:hypothetical protein
MSKTTEKSNRKEQCQKQQKRTTEGAKRVEGMLTINSTAFM